VRKDKAFLFAAEVLIRNGFNIDNGIPSGICKEGKILKKVSVAIIMVLFLIAPVDAGEIQKPLNPRLDDSPGTIVGTAPYAIQSIGAAGIRIARHECGTHIAWMTGLDNWYGNRWIYYNFIRPDGSPKWDEGTQVSDGQGAGFCQLTTDSVGCQMIVYHDYSYPYSGLILAKASFCGSGFFTFYDIPHSSPGHYDFYWPYIDFDNSGNIHVTACENTPTPGEFLWLAHTISTDGGSTWTDLELVDSLLVGSGFPVSSSVDDKVALVYPKPILEDSQFSQYSLDVAYIESEDGLNWNYNEKINVTNYQHDDTMRASSDIAACYDYDSDLHILWTARGYWAGTGRVTNDSCLLLHWSEATGITIVDCELEPSSSGTGDLTACKMSISCGQYDHLFALWTHFNDWDTSEAGYSNGELYIAASCDDGANWCRPVNITNTQTPGCVVGTCESEYSSTMARLVDDSIYITYIEDVYAGVVPGGQMTNRVRYYVIQNPLWPVVTIDDQGENMPAVFHLEGNYPNPFNASTNISFRLNRDSDIVLEVFNILGEKVATLADGRFSKGDHTVSWDGSAFSSGVYLYRLSNRVSTQTMRMVLLK
jgi:hypothetical protein